MFKILIVVIYHLFISFNRYSRTFENKVHSLFSGCKTLSTSYIKLIDCIFNSSVFAFIFFFSLLGVLSKGNIKKPLIVMVILSNSS